MAVVLRKWWFWALVALLFVALVFTVLASGGSARQDQTLTQFIASAKSGEIKTVEVDGAQITYHLSGNDATTYKTKMERGDTVRAILQDAGIQPANFPDIEVRERSPLANFIGVILQLIPLILIITLIVWLVRRSVQGQTSTLVAVSETDPVCGRKVLPNVSAGSSTF
ncbi:MAG TPA: ATP-dependent metallopeptidase FtsH/Yme1/Tma family protein, partial [Dehalococcoidia bacterium]|nr:ATP-dependent metallopeptidase FtsH/Yme1/Tma family protein [Dehalococcoidia bacterium]